MGARWKHFKTITKHRWIVRHECFACGLIWNGLVHDVSKYFPSEFGPSAFHFQGNRSPIEAEKEQCGYSLAWLHHKGCNRHHWEYWTDFGENGDIVSYKIPYKYVVEMVSDWIGAGKVYSKDRWNQHEPLNYFYKVRAGRHFHHDTEQLIVAFLKCIDFYGLKEFHRMARSKETRETYERATKR